MERDCESELSKLNIEQNACIYHFGASVIHGQRSNILRLLYNKHNRSYFEALEVKAEKMAKKYDCAFVDNEMPYGRVPQGHPVIVDYFYHEEIRGTENTGKRNR